MALAFKKGFLQSVPEASGKPVPSARKKKAALPDEAFLPAESYDLEEEEEEAADPLIADITSSEEAYQYSVEYCRAHCNKFNQGLMKLDAMVNVSFANDLKAVMFNRKLWGHHDGPAGASTRCASTSHNMLLPSGLVLHYREWGNEQAPPIVLLHDVADCNHVWDDIAQPLSERYRVLSIDFRGHGESSRSSRREYGIEVLVGDVHELVVRLSLNGRQWGGDFTRPWVMCGKGMGGAVAVAYAARHAGRVAGVVLWDYDPEMPKDRLCFSRYQAGHFSGQEPLAYVLGKEHDLLREAKYLAIMFTNRCEYVNPEDINSGCRFRMDPYFFLVDFNPGLAWTQLRAVAARCKVKLVHMQNSRDWSYERAAEVHAMLEDGGESAPAGVELVVASRGTMLDEEQNMVEDLHKLFSGIALHILSFADELDRAARAKLKSEGDVRYEPISKEELEAKEATRNAIRQAAREAAGFMGKDDPPPPNFEDFDD